MGQSTKGAAVSKIEFPEVEAITKMGQGWIIRFKKRVTGQHVRVLTLAAHENGYSSSVEAQPVPGLLEIWITYIPYEPDNVKDWLCRYLNFVPPASAS
jgi:hypothetical protein